MSDIPNQLHGRSGIWVRPAPFLALGGPPSQWSIVGIRVPQPHLGTHLERLLDDSIYFSPFPWFRVQPLGNHLAPDGVFPWIGGEGDRGQAGPGAGQAGQGRRAHRRSGGLVLRRRASVGAMMAETQINWALLFFLACSAVIHTAQQLCHLNPGQAIHRAAPGYQGSACRSTFDPHYCVCVCCSVRSSSPSHPVAEHQPGGRRPSSDLYT